MDRMDAMADSSAERVDEDTRLEEARINQILGAEVRAWRNRRGMSQDGLADAAGYDKKTIGRWERGERAMDSPQLIRISRALSVNPSVLIDAAYVELNVE